MDYLRRNLGSLTLILFAIAAFASELAGALPDEAGTELAKYALIALAAARGLVNAAEALGGHTPSPPAQDDELELDGDLVASAPVEGIDAEAVDAQGER